MTTAGRPTWDAARGGGGKGETDLSALSKQYSARDLPSHTKLKYREKGQAAPDELKKKDFKRDLEVAERESRSSRRRDRSRADDEASSTKKSRSEGHAALPAAAPPPPADVDADDPVDESSNDESSDDDEDDEALMKELAKIKQERLLERQKQEEARRKEEERIRMENILSGNPLMGARVGAGKGDFTVKRRWDEDVVFKNCAKGDIDKHSQGFINDSLRSTFHRKFMEKYIK